MASFNDMPPMARIGIIVGLAVALAVGAYMGLLKNMDEQNRVALQALHVKQAENAELKSYEPKLADLDRQISSLKSQMEIQRKIVPDEKEADRFIVFMQETATNAGINIRRFTTKSIVNREFYSEMPFEMDIDGPYYNVLHFFERVSKLERIINIDGLSMANVKKSGVVKKNYTYSPNESVVATYIAKTFFTTEAKNQPAAGAPAKSGIPAAK